MEHPEEHNRGLHPPVEQCALSVDQSKQTMLTVIMAEPDDMLRLLPYITAEAP
jgi:hypothetical protein